MTTVRLASNVEVLLGILGELMEEERQERVNVLTSIDGGADLAAAVGVADVDGLVKEDDGSIVVPGVGVADNLNLLVDGGRAELQEEAGQRRAAWATVEPENNRVVLGVVSGLKEPCTLSALYIVSASWAG